MPKVYYICALMALTLCWSSPALSACEGFLNAMSALEEELEKQQSTRAAPTKTIPYAPATKTSTPINSLQKSRPNTQNTSQTVNLSSKFAKTP